MSDPVELAIIAGCVAVIPTILSFLTFLISKNNERHLAQMKDTVITLEKNTNSIKDELVKVTGEAAFAKGLKSGQENPEQKGV